MAACCSPQAGLLQSLQALAGLAAQHQGTHCERSCSRSRSMLAASPRARRSSAAVLLSCSPVSNPDEPAIEI